MSPGTRKKIANEAADTSAAEAESYSGGLHTATHGGADTRADVDRAIKADKYRNPRANSRYGHFL